MFREFMDYSNGDRCIIKILDTDILNVFTQVYFDLDSENIYNEFIKLIDNFNNLKENKYFYSLKRNNITYTSVERFDSVYEIKKRLNNWEE